MSDLISREDAIRALVRSSVYAWSVEQDQSAHNWAISIIESLPSAEAEDRLYIKIYADDEPSVKAEKLYQICGETQNREVTEWLKEYFPSTNDNWIPVSERLPKVTDTVLVQDVCGDIETVQVCTRYDGSLIFDGEWEYELEEVVVWQPLPTPYKGGDDE